ncbi:MAG: hypothetical protein AAGC56_11830 [Pseudomonadota bacterium]
MRPILFATCLEQPAYQPSDALAAAALEARGASVRAVPWNGPADAFVDEAAIVVRSTWDYARAGAEFAGWLDGLSARPHVFNPPALMLWNLSKRYLEELQEAGVVLPPTRFAPPTRAAVDAAIDALGVDEAVVKPAIDAGAEGLSRVRRGDDTAAAVEKLRGADALVQAYVPAIATLGETSFIFIGGAYSHAIAKSPKAGDIRVQEEHGGVSVRAEARGFAVDEARRIVRLIEDRAGAPALYARVDAIVDGESAMLDERFRLMEVELIEPDLFFHVAPDGAERFADALLAQLS